MVMRVATQLATHGRLQRGYLGVTLDPDFDAADAKAAGLPRLYGARVKTVNDRQSPAARAGLESGDVVISFDGITIDDDDHLVTIVGLTDIGKPAPVILVRQGKQYKVDVTLVQLP